MAHLYGKKREAGNNTEWHPIAVTKVGEEYILAATTIVSGVVEHHNGDAELIAATVTFSGETSRAVIENMSGTATVSVSFDGGANYRTIAIGATLDVVASVTSLEIKASAASTPYEILAIV